MRDENTSTRVGFVHLGKQDAGWFYNLWQDAGKQKVTHYVTWRTATLTKWDWDMLRGASFIWPQILDNDGLCT